MTALGNPLAHAHGSVEELFLTGLYQAKICDTIDQGAWPLLLRAITIPLSYKIYVDRTDKVTYKGALRVGELLIQD